MSNVCTSNHPTIQAAPGIRLCTVCGAPKPKRKEPQIPEVGK